MEYNRTTALIVVDVQNDFVLPTGSLGLPGAEAILPVLNAAIDGAVAAGAHVVYTKDWHPPETPHFHSEKYPSMVHCVRDTEGAAFHSGLRIVGGPIVHKGTGQEDGFSGFSAGDPDGSNAAGSELARILHDLGIERVAVSGVALEGCVAATALDAVRFGFETTLLRGASGAADIEPGAVDRALSGMVEAGITIED